MKTFKQFPEGAKCPICGTSDPGECTLVSIVGTQQDNLVQAAPTHVECIDLWLDKQLELVFQWLAK